eukprot:Nitzschia sp. Nitz4//scaffold60_size111251//90559//91531//NITZ4_004159-RA/size111251-augustus-gene-0.125-mRNA-1//-1//CDS//3329555600//363//frame0
MTPSRSTFLLCFLLGVSAVLSEGFIPALALPRLTSARWFSPIARSSVTTTSSICPSLQPKSPSFFPSRQQQLLIQRGGSAVMSQSTTASTTPDAPKSTTSGPFGTGQILGALWGSLGMVYTLLKAVKKVMPIALEPFFAGSSLVLSPVQWGIYAVTVCCFAYYEGYKAFHKKVSPLVVKRSFLLSGDPVNTNPGNPTVLLNYIFAPTYSIGMFRATRKRMMTSWGVTIGVTLMVAAMKRMPPLWRCIIDAGVVAGLSTGALSIIYHLAVSLKQGSLPEIDACMPALSVDADKDKKE